MVRTLRGSFCDLMLIRLSTAYGDTHLICSCDSVEDYAGTDDAELKISGGVESNT